MIYTLLERLKPNHLTALNSQEDQYDETVNKIKGWLKENVFFDALTIHQVQCLKTFTDSNLTQINQIDLLYGDEWFYTNEEYKSILNTEVNEAERV